MSLTEWWQSQASPCGLWPGCWAPPREIMMWETRNCWAQDIPAHNTHMICYGPSIGGPTCRRISTGSFYHAQTAPCPKSHAHYLPAPSSGHTLSLLVSRHYRLHFWPARFPKKCSHPDHHRLLVQVHQTHPLTWPLHVLPNSWAHLPSLFQNFDIPKDILVTEVHSWLSMSGLHLLRSWESLWASLQATILRLMNRKREPIKKWVNFSGPTLLTNRRTGPNSFLGQNMHKTH